MEEILLQSLTTSPLSTHLDQDTSDYILSILNDDPNDVDAREAVRAFVISSLDDVDDDKDYGNAEEICNAFFEQVDAALGNNSTTIIPSSEEATDLPRRLDAAITLKSHDIQSFASGLVANIDHDTHNDGQPSEIQSFYANMIDVSKHPRAKSERERRKARQREMREQMEDEERKRAIEDAVRMMEEEREGMKEDDEVGMGAMDNATDVHFTVSILSCADFCLDVFL